MKLRLLLLLLAAGGAAAVAAKRRQAAAALPQGNATTYSPPAPAPSNYDQGPGDAGPDTSGPMGAAGRPVSDEPPIDTPQTIVAETAPDPLEALVAEEEAAAAAEAAAIGGRGTDDGHGDPAMQPVYEAGGGESEGFEAAEDLLIQNASHGEGHARPHTDAFTPEVEADRSSAEYGEADHQHATEGDPDNR
jgi:hypothetical protein